VKILFVLSLFLFLVGCSESAIDRANKVDISQAQPYFVIKTDSFSAPEGRDRLRIVVHAPAAVTKSQRAQTAIKAAFDYQKETGAYEVESWLEALPKVSERIAIADYYPYKKKAWGDASPYMLSVEASDYVIEGELKPNDIILNKVLEIKFSE
jgi:hypothetical protein